MENTPIKLQPPLPAWHGFEDNQVLTADLLNDTTRYLDVQTRRSRVALTGVGVVSGLQPEAEGGTVRVSRGFGLTSDGDLIGFAENQTFGKAAEFTDPKALYPPFRNDGALGALWELLPADSTQPDALPLTDFFAQRPAADLVAVLYAEQFLEKHEICRADRCDAAGVTLEDLPRLLLLTRDDAKRLLETGAGLLPELPPLAVRRVKFSEKITQFNQLAAAYQAAIQPTLAALDLALNAADAPLNALLTRWQTATGAPFAGVEAGGGAALAQRFAEKVAAVQGGHLVQYAYDALRDLVAAYTEFREALDGLNLSVLASPGAFPKHLLLGTLQPADGDAFRMAFQPSVAQVGRVERLETALNLYRRMQMLVETFDPTQVLQQVTVTPSAGPGAALGERAIPVYYRVAALEADWQAHRRGPKPLVLSCHGLGQRNRPAEVASPLDFDWPGADFYRIEGHLNAKFSEVKARLDALRREQDLPFDVIGIQIEEDARSILWPPVFHFPALDWTLHSQKAHLMGKMAHLTAFNDELGQRLDEAVGSADVEPLADALGGRAELTRKHGETKSLQTSVSRHAQTLRGALDDEAAGSLRELHAQLSPVAAQLNLAAKPFVNASVAAQTPLDAQALHVAPHLLDYLRDQRRQQETEAKGRFFFDNFLREHPALLHAGGVPLGGTFCLVYRQDGTVVADFYLPHAWQPAAPEPFKPLPLPDFKPPIGFKPLLQFDREQPKILFRKDLPDVTRTLPGLVESRVNPVKTDLIGQLGLVHTRLDATVSDVGQRLDGLNRTVDAKLDASRADFTARVGAVTGEVQGVSKRVDEQVQSFVANYQKTVESSQKLADQYAVVIGKNAQRVQIKDLGDNIGSIVDDDGKERVVISADLFAKYVKLGAGQQLPPADADAVKLNAGNALRKRLELLRPHL